MPWTIEAKLLPITAVSGHLYLEVFDDRGQRVMQVNGFASDPVTGAQKSVGVIGDKLRAYVDDFNVISREFNRDNHPHEGRVIFRGGAADVQKAMKAMVKAAAELNKRDLSYWLFRQNSNSVFMHMVEVVSAHLPVDRVAVNEVLQLRTLLPGTKNHLPPPAKKSSKPKPPPPGM